MFAQDEQEGITELLALHEFEHSDGFEGAEHQYAKTRPWRYRVVDEVIERKDNKIFDFYHAFKAQDYQKPAEVNGVNGFSGGSDVDGVDNVSRSITGTTSFGSRWQLDGCGDLDAPLIVFSNSLLTDLHIWDKALAQLKDMFPKYRFLRYNTRGYESHSEETTSISTLTDDLCDLLGSLGVDKCLAVVGVSLGGITCMSFAAKYPSRLDKFIACDCNVASAPKNNEAWRARVSLAKSQGGWAKLADQTVKRWFTRASIQSPTEATSAVRNMILSASMHGFVGCVNALCDYDLTEDVEHIQAPGLCVVGKDDGVLPGAMAAFTKTIPHASLVEIEEAGHLPMVEQPQDFVAAVADFLSSS